MPATRSLSQGPALIVSVPAVRRGVSGQSIQPIHGLHARSRRDTGWSIRARGWRVKLVPSVSLVRQGVGGKRAGRQQPALRESERGTVRGGSGQIWLEQTYARARPADSGAGSDRK